MEPAPGGGALRDGAPVPVLYVHFGEDRIRGSERCLLDLLSHLDRSRFAPLVWCNAPLMAEEVAKLGFQVRTNRFTILLHWDRPRFAVRRFLALAKEGTGLIRAHGARIVHANSGAPVQWMLPASRRAGVPLLAHLHADYVLRERCTLGLHHVDLAVGASEAVILGLLADGMPKARTRVIHNAVDVERLRRGDATGLRSELGIAAGEIVVSSAGALVRLKGFDVLIRAVAQLRRAGHPIRLLLMGDGPERGSLESLAAREGLAGAAHFLGERKDVGAVFRDATDVVAVPSRAESFGLTAIEAAAFGLPVVASRVQGLPEAVVEGVTGFLVPPDATDALADAIGALAGDEPLRRRLGAEARSRCAARFTVERYTGDFEDAYEALLAVPRSALGWRGPWGPSRPWLRLIGGALLRRLPWSRRPSD
jgi:L-malate glycosyltransferase